MSIEENTIFFKKMHQQLSQLTSVRFQHVKKGLSRFMPQFVININTFCETKKHNAYFNGKLYIDTNGNLKNSIETDEVYNNIATQDASYVLYKTVKSKEFRKIWKVNKDKIDVCKDCEFRYMCIDNRIPIERIDRSFYNSLECSYNPYISKWVGDLDYYTLIGTGVYSNEKGFSKDVNKIAQINEQIWRDS